MEQEAINKVNKELSEYSISRERVLIISDDTGNIIEEVVYSLDEILEAEEDYERDIDSDYFNDLNNEDLESPIHSDNDSFQCELNTEEIIKIEGEYLKIIGDFYDNDGKENDTILDEENKKDILSGSILTEENTTPNETVEDPKETLLKKFRELKTGDEIRSFVIINLDYFEGFFERNNRFFKILKEKFNILSIITLKSLNYDLKGRGKDFEELVIQLEDIIYKRLLDILNGSSNDQKDGGIIITNGYNEIISNKNSKFIVVKNIKTGESYIIAKGYDEGNNKITFELHREIFQYFLDKIGFSLGSEFSAYDYEVKGGGYIQVNKNGELYLHKESMDFGQADFEFTKNLIEEKFGKKVSYYKR